MDSMESKMASILGNPQMMEKIQALANSFGEQESASNQSYESPEENRSEPVSSGGFPELDLDMIRKISGLMGKSQIDPNQRSLLKALTPYVNAQRISKLERAMRAAKMAGMASALLKGGR